MVGIIPTFKMTVNVRRAAIKRAGKQQLLLIFEYPNNPSQGEGTLELIALNYKHACEQVIALGFDLREVILETIFS